ncbi:glycine hydroxymethyltransferase, partial [Candidatus Peregrinibacteria bacterium]|nr:glycine hydroxymethyltransferase [Candidatus Peregrinibacteria bacterium]
PAIAERILKELADQRSNLKMIASENYSSLSVQQAMGNLMTDKYAEGVPGARFYAGCENVDAIEKEAADLACELFGAEHAYVQPHSGADANLVAFTSILAAKVHRGFLDEVTAKMAAGGEAPKDIRSLGEADWVDLRQKTFNQKMMALDIGSGGHLTHGYRMNISAWLFDAHQYAVSKETGLLDYDQIAAMAREVKPLILLAGFSAYPRRIDFARMRAIADEVGAVLMVDMAHFAGLVAGGVFTGEFNPIPYADIVTSTTHKTLRGPRGGIVLCKKWLAEFVDKGCPAVLGGPLPHVMAAKALAFREALRPEFKTYAAKIVENSSALAEECVKQDMKVLTGGTENHLLQINVFDSFGITGRQAEEALRECGITLNRNAIPFDPNGVWYTSGLRLGTPALTTLGMGVEEMRIIAGLLKRVLSACKPAPGKDGKPGLAKYILDSAVRDQVKAEVGQLLSRFKLYPELE